ncbi:unnamed protein product [Victoria cruziana]
MHFDPVVVLNHFVAPGMAEPSTMGGANEQGGSVDKRIRSRIDFFRLTHFIRQANDLRFAGTTKTTISLFPFFVATFFFPRDGVGVSNNLIEDAQEQLVGQLRSKLRNLMDKEKVIKLIEKFIDIDVVGVANRTVHNLVLEDMTPKVVKLVIFPLKPLKQRIGLQSDNSIVL